MNTECAPICPTGLRLRLRTAQLTHLRGKTQSVIHGLETGVLSPELSARVLLRALDEVEAMGSGERDLTTQTDWRG